MYFIFKGIKSTEMGVTVLTQPPIKSPESRTWDSFIDNKDGADSLFLGYKPIELSMEIAVEGKENLDKVLGWLDGEGQLIRSDFPDRYRNVHIVEGIELNMIHPELWQGSFTYLVVDPYWYKVGDEWTEVKKNIIPNGWKSFGPYGTEGTETRAPIDVFKEGYSRNLLNKTDDIRTSDGYGVSDWMFDVAMEDGEDYTISFEYEIGEGEVTKDRFGIYNSGGSNGLHWGGYDNTLKGWRKYSATFKGKKVGTNTFIRIYNGPSGGTGSISIKNVKLEKGTKSTAWVPSWSDLESDKKPVRAWDNMYLHINDAGEGLTRIRTSGGSDKLKLIYSIGKKETEHSVSGYYQNKGKNILRVLNNQGYSFYDIPGGDSVNVSLNGDPSHTGHVQYAMLAREIGDDLDFVSGDPLLVEGKTPYLPTPIEGNMVIDKIGTIESNTGEGFKIVKLNKEVSSGEIQVTTTMLPNVHTDNILVSYWYDSKLVKEEVVKVSGEGKVHSRHTVLEGEPVNRVYLYKDTSFATSKDKEAIYLGTEITVTYKKFPEVDGYVENEGNTKSYPIIHLKNNSKDTNVVRLNINDSIIRYEFPQGETEVFINLMGMRAGTESSHTGYYRHDVRDKYLYVERDKGMHLNPGPNTITSDGDVEIKLLRKDRWI